MSDTAEEIVHSLAEDVADKFGGDIEDHPQEYLEKQARLQLYEDIALEVLAISLPKGVDETCARLLRDNQFIALRKYFGIESDVPTQDTEGGK